MRPNSNATSETQRPDMGTDNNSYRDDVGTRTVINSQSAEPDRQGWVRETKFGRRFLQSGIWSRYVLDVAISGFKEMLDKANVETGKSVWLDAGCGAGLTLEKIDNAFQPASILGVDVDAESLVHAQKFAALTSCDCALQQANLHDAELPDDTFDFILCHQLIHHVGNQQKVLSNLFSALKPGGRVLIAESCKPFIYSAIVQLLFKHPNANQKNAEEYFQLFREAGFVFDRKDIRESTPRWSRRYFGIVDFFKIRFGKPLQTTEILVVASKPH